MIIKMLISMSGGRDDDRAWPGVGVPFEVSDEEGEGLVRWHHAIKVGDSPVPVKAHVTAPAPVSLPAETAAGPVSPPPPEPPLPAVHDLPEDPRPASMTQPVDTEMLGVDDDPENDPEPPKPADPKQAWIDYAVTGAPAGKRIPRAQAEGMTKADLMSMFGERL
jgi:hypothetical protein